MVEQYTKTVEEHLRKVISMHQKDWDERLPIFLLAHRTSSHKTTCTMSPAWCMGESYICPVYSLQDPATF
jgi:hypothetical protein